MLLRGLLASVETGINRILRLDSTALARLQPLTGKVIAVECASPALHLFILPSDEGLLLAAHWAADADCTLRAPASSLLRLALSKDKSSILHGPEVELEGDSHVLMALAAVLLTHTGLPLSAVRPMACMAAAVGAAVSAAVLARRLQKRLLLCGLGCGAFYAVCLLAATLLANGRLDWQGSNAMLPLALLLGGLLGGALTALRAGR